MDSGFMDSIRDAAKFGATLVVVVVIVYLGVVAPAVLLFGIEEEKDFTSEIKVFNEKDFDLFEEVTEPTESDGRIHFEDKYRIYSIPIDGKLVIVQKGESENE